MTATPWPEPEYDNDVGPNDEGFWEHYEIAGVGIIYGKDDAKLIIRAVNCHDELLAALEDAADVVERLSDELVADPKHNAGLAAEAVLARRLYLATIAIAKATS